MARLKKTSTILETARQRLAGFRSITPVPDFGPGLTLANYETSINSFGTRLDNYNERLSSLDQLLNELEDAESELREHNRRMLSAAEAHYGPDSSEYEQVGGTRTSDRRRSGTQGEAPVTPPPA
jgi:hypothetical protein